MENRGLYMGSFTDTYRCRWDRDREISMLSRLSHSSKGVLTRRDGPLVVRQHSKHPTQRNGISGEHYSARGSRSVNVRHRTTIETTTVSRAVGMAECFDRAPRRQIHDAETVAMPARDDRPQAQLPLDSELNLPSHLLTRWYVVQMRTYDCYYRSVDYTNNT